MSVIHKTLHDKEKGFEKLPDSLWTPYRRFPSPQALMAPLIRKDHGHKRENKKITRVERRFNKEGGFAVVGGTYRS
jgi:hypothetical protein